MRALRPGGAAVLAALLLLPGATAHGAGSISGRVAFVAAVGDGSGISSVSIADGRVTQLTRGPNDYAPAWSPDGRRLVFVRFTDPGQDLYVVDAAGGGATPLLSLPPGSSADNPAWSPNGAGVAYSQTPGIGGAHDVMVVPAAGGSPVDLTNSPSDDLEPAWSPDGTQIVYSSWVDGLRRPQLWVMNADGSSQARLTDNAWDDFAPAWSPDGTRIAFTRFGPGQGGVWIKSVAAGAERRITDAVGYDQHVSWSPDGKWIAFGRVVAGSTHLFVVGSSGGTPVPLPVEGYGPVWRPVAVDLGVSVSAPAAARVGAAIPLTVSIANGGSRGASGVTVRVALAPHVNAAGRGCRGGATFVCTIGRLASAATATVKIVARASRPGALRIAASVAGAEADGEPSNDRATASVAVR